MMKPFYQDLTNTDFPEAGLAAHQALTESWRKAIVSETITKAYEKARPQLMRACKNVLEGRGFHAYTSLRVDYDLSKTEMAASYNRGVDIDQAYFHLDAADLDARANMKPGIVRRLKYMGFQSIGEAAQEL